ncbi:MAG: molecular chaperone HtpG [Flavobacteriales bacterium]|nr:molecular chaperone HtpG [Flavobacteriales bacterium]MCB9174225.1 molecular chaperone HtpG [Flavobacteriales bacterium]
MAKGKIKVQTENIFPIIKKFLYSDHEIFLRELIANATDATKKLHALASMGEFKGDVGNDTIEIILDKKAKTLTVRDRGIGMSEEEIKKYINQIAFSGAEEFVNKFKDKTETGNIIGKFGLGFYSSFMVAERVEILSKNYKDEPAAHWECDGSPEYSLKEGKKEDRGTDIILHIAEDSTEFLEESRIKTLLEKYCKFMPVSIKFGTKTEYIDNKKGKKDKDGNVEKEAIQVDNIINNPSPAWTKTPSTLTDEDYAGFYRELYPFNFEESLFHIHLNVDYPFNLTGILYFPKIKPNMEVQKDKIQLYSRQVFITDSVEGIVPDFLTLLHGVIDSPDIPLNVSRSYLQSDGNVKKISNHITKKVADKLEELFKKDRADFEKKWDDIKIFIEYGMLSDEKFFERAQKFALYKNTDGKYYTQDELIEKIKPLQTDKDDKLVVLYASDLDTQYTYIQSAKDKGYEVIILDSPLSPHLVGKLEQTIEKTTFTRIDADTIDKIINKNEEIPSKLTDADKDVLKPVLEEVISKEKFTIQFESMNETDQPMTIVQPEFMRRMKEMSKMGGGGMMGMGNFPEMYNLVVNVNHPVISKMLKEKDGAKQKEIAKQTADLALLSQNMLKGEELTNFIKRSIELI